MIIMVYIESSDSNSNRIVYKSDIESFNKAIDRARQLLDNVGVEVDCQRLQFELVTRKQMDVYDKSYLGMHFDLGYGSIIWVVEKQSLLQTISTLAHEMGHAWICQNGIKVTEMENEGFCQVLSYYILRTEFSKDGNYEATLVKDFADEVYGDGFRLMQRKLDCLGWRQLIMLLRF